MYVNVELKFLSGRSGVRFVEVGQVRCEQRSEVFVKIEKKKLGGGGVRSGEGGGGVRVDVNEELKFLLKFKKKKFRGGGGGSGGGGQGGCDRRI